MKRNHRLCVLVSDDELNDLRNEAATVYLTVSQWVRKAVREAVEERRRKPAKVVRR